MKKIQKFKIFTKSRGLLINKSFILKIERRGEKNPLFNILLNEKIEN